MQTTGYLLLGAMTLTLGACAMSSGAPRYHQQDATTGSLFHSQDPAATAEQNSSSYTVPHDSVGHN